MCMRPSAWGGMILIGVVAFVGLSTVRTARRDNHHATVVVEQRTPDGNAFVIGSDARKVSSRAASTRKVKLPRVEDANRVVYGPVMVEGEFCETEDQAYESAIESARGRLLHDLDLADLPSSEWVRDRLGEHRIPEQRPGVIGDQPAYRMKLEVELTRAAYLELAEADRAIRVTRRMDGAGHVLAIAVVALGALAGYVRLDEFTKGYYTGRLRFLTIALVAAATFAISRV